MAEFVPIIEKEIASEKNEKLFLNIKDKSKKRKEIRTT